jgi:alpha-L-fucosidase 2
VTSLVGGELLQTPQPLRFVGEAAPLRPGHEFWYRQAASPKRNGSARFRVETGDWARWYSGGVVNERLQLNEDTLWAGVPYDPVNPDARDALPECPAFRLAAGQYSGSREIGKSE